MLVNTIDPLLYIIMCCLDVFSTYIHFSQQNKRMLLLFGTKIKFLKYNSCILIQGKGNCETDFLNDSIAFKIKCVYFYYLPDHLCFQTNGYIRFCSIF